MWATNPLLLWGKCLFGEILLYCVLPCWDRVVFFFFFPDLVSASLTHFYVVLSAFAVDKQFI